MGNTTRILFALAVSLTLVFSISARAEEPEPELGVQPNVKESKVPDVANGEALANKLCVGCHVIERGTTAIPQPDVPSFPTIADRPSQTVEALTTWLLQPHAPMPDPHLSRVEIRDLAGYIISLRKSP